MKSTVNQWWETFADAYGLQRETIQWAAMRRAFFCGVLYFIQIAVYTRKNNKLSTEQYHAWLDELTGEADEGSRTSAIDFQKEETPKKEAH